MDMDTPAFKVPDQVEVCMYFVLLGLGKKHADAFYYYYNINDWKTEDGQPAKNWKVLAFNWVLSFAKAKPIRKQSIYC